MAEDLMAIAGLSSIEEAQNFLEMAGGDLESAINLFYSMNDGGAAFGSSSQAQQNDRDWPDYFGLVWDTSREVNEAWLQQDLSFSDHEGEEMGILQFKNGPCGILAVIQAILIVQRLKSGESLFTAFEKDEIAHAIAKILLNCTNPKKNEKVKLCLWKEPGQIGAVTSKSVKQDELEKEIMDNIDMYTGKGCLFLIVFSCVETRTPEQVRKDTIKGGGEPLLIVGPNGLCSSELMMLLLQGVANGSFGAYSLTGGKTELNIPCGVGMLSFTETESGIPVHDILKSPAYPVWILHSGDHFTVLFMNKMVNDTKNLKPPVKVFHYNGLPPGVQLSELEIQGNQVAAPAPKVKKEAYWKPAIGEIEDVVQADPDDKKSRPEEWQTWKYEVVLAVEQDDVTGPERPSDAPPPVIFDCNSQPINNKPWRCANCYRNRFKTMCFGQNPENTNTCQNCGLPSTQAQWSMWLSFAELPEDWKRKMNRRHAPKLITTLSTKWPDCDVKLVKSSRNLTKIPTC